MQQRLPENVPGFTGECAGRFLCRFHLHRLWHL